MADLGLDSTQLIHLRASQYLSAAGLVVLLWDHLLTFGDEVRFIWSAKLSAPKVLFLFNRYVVPIAMIIQAYGFSGLASPRLTSTAFRGLIILESDCSPHSCKGWTAAAASLGMITIGTSNFLVLLRLWVLWDRSRRLMVWTLTLFVLTQITALATTAYLISQMIPFLVYMPTMQVCLLSQKVDFAMLWYPGVAFEVMIFVTTFWNAVDRPRAHNTQMAKILYRDGSAYFFVLFGLRLTNLILAIAAPLSLIFLGVFFIWCAVNVTLTRLILNLRRLSEAESREGFIDDEPPDLPVLLRNGSIASQSYELQTKDSR
ncbi:hypothetical protein BV22DRAFT_1128780 [Leucogyrophana mollusca]|uniref:Uncharacterized protein n=1 Tax=Leucogyrophana mollusca TaxID=85980 RepID=A0ACB8BIR1_9AGAM|nr:hypothetical protein BV22DRAFT_1128780 [Leucogyrophana mollusca]